MLHSLMNRAAQMASAPKGATLGATDSEYYSDPRATGDSALLTEQQQKVEAIAERAESCLRGVEREAVHQDPGAAGV